MSYDLISSYATMTGSVCPITVRFNSMPAPGEGMLSDSIGRRINHVAALHLFIATCKPAIGTDTGLYINFSDEFCCISPGKVS